jgi:putative DNA primase/helicase
MIAAVARIFRPGCQSDHTLLLEGNQGIGKSSALRVLAGDDYFTDHMSDLGSKDSRVELSGKWIVEMAELDTVRRAALERVKAYLTARFDNFRPPYGRNMESLPRSCVFAATTNDHAALNDETGNRRFWPVRCNRVDVNGLKRDRDQLWAEAYGRFKNGECWWLETADLAEAARQEQEQRYEGDPWDDEILEWCDNPQSKNQTVRLESNADAVTVTDVLIHCIEKPLERITQTDKNRVARCLGHAGWTRAQLRRRRKRSWFYVRPAEVSQN